MMLVHSYYKLALHQLSYNADCNMWFMEGVYSVGNQVEAFTKNLRVGMGWGSCEWLGGGRVCLPSGHLLHHFKEGRFFLQNQVLLFLLHIVQVVWRIV